MIPSKERSSVLAWYILSGTLGTASGTILCGWVVQQLQTQRHWSAIDSYRVVFWVYAVAGLVKLLLSCILSAKSEPEKKAHEASPREEDGEIRPLLDGEGLVNGNKHKPKPKSESESTSWFSSLLPSLSPESQSLVFKLCLLFAIDSIASGLVPSSWITYFFNRKFGLTEGSLGSLFFVTNIVSSASNLVASSIARRIGLIKTMVFTHMPASVALALIPFPSQVIIAMILLIFRSSTASMDQAPRQAFLAAAVLPAERTAVMGIVNVVKTLSQSLGPVVTGVLAGRGKFWVSFVAAGSLKIAYDVLLLGMFLGYRTQEERAEAQVLEAQEEAREDGRDEVRDAA